MMKIMTFMRGSLTNLLSSSPFTKYLLVTNVASSGAIDFFGDFLTQKLIEKSESNDWKRNSRMGFVGLVLGLPLHYWYVNLDKWIPKNGVRQIAKKVILDVSIASPFCIVVFYVGMSRLEGKSWKEATMEMKKKFWITYLIDLSLWPTFQAFNFYFLPLSLRLIASNIGCLGYAMILSVLKHQD